jgi:hypothetical protein
MHRNPRIAKTAANKKITMAACFFSALAVNVAADPIT